MSQRLENKVAIVTGAAQGIGRAIARAYAEEGAKVVLVDIEAELAQAAAAEIAATGAEALGLAADVGSAADVDRVFEQVLERFGTVDIVVNNAGYMKSGVHFLDVDDEFWERVIRTNLTGNYLFISRAARIMVEKESGVFINMSSGGAVQAHRGMVPYDASKGGIEGLTRAAAIELAPYGIRVNAIVPGLIASRDDEPAEATALRDATVPLGRGGRPSDIVGAAIFLASDESAYITGAKLAIDGGVLVQQRSPQVDTFRVEQYPAVGRLKK